ncbi:MAG TPA: hypothetical protein VEZ14_08255 [Dehalococcoidia bacterium]|nr:hypothetical protein [Dehalococcoidia bacterium]
MRQRYILPIACITALALVGSLLGYRAVHSQDPVVAQVNGTLLDSQGISRMQTVTARVRTRNPAYNPSIDSWVRDTVAHQEAIKRGLACSGAQARQQLQANYQQTVLDGHPEAFLIVAEDSGIAPQGYHLTPEAQRTPDTQTMIDTYMNDARVIALQAKLCAITALANSVNTPKVNGIATLVAAAKASGAVVIAATDTPAAPTPVPPTATATP